MTQEEQTFAFTNELWCLINRFGDEFEMQHETVIGCLAKIQHQLLAIDDEIMKGEDDE